MKRITVLIFFLVIISSSKVNAQTQIPLPSLSPSPTPEENVEYELPYPGILPGNFFYNIKIARDRITDFLIQDPLEKANFYLLQADKRSSAGLMLFEKGKQELGETTISKSQNYHEKSLGKAIEAKSRGDNIGEITGKLETSIAKQKQEIKRILKTAKGETAEKLKSDLRRAEILEKNVKANKPKR